MDSELEEVFGDVGSLPTMVTPVCDIDGALCVSLAEGPVIAPPAMSAFVIRPLMATSPAGLKTLSVERFHPSHVSSVPRMSPVVAIEVFNMCLVYTPDGIILTSWILYNLSELVVLEPSRTDLYLEAKVVDAKDVEHVGGAKDVEHVGNVLDQGRSVQFDSRPESMI